MGRENGEDNAFAGSSFLDERCVKHIRPGFKVAYTANTRAVDEQLGGIAGGRDGALLLEEAIGGSVKPEVQSKLRGIETAVEEIIRAARSLSFELSAQALESEELVDAFAWLAEVMEQQHQFRVKVDLEHPCIVTDRRQRGLLVRMVRELFFNLVKHTGVEEARAQAKRDGDAVIVSVVDNGVGFTADTALQSIEETFSFGLMSVREQVRLLEGNFEFDSVPGEGARATIIVPR